ncbi:MAG: YegS/Rv2252/BmrU family lipid kinase [Anaerovoracaceae bacterium]|nr:YegS/Rv2252/BmrU family lipid kinase [Anaerovoracaceae bacterium]
MADKREKVLLFYNPTSGNGMFKHNLDQIIGRFQDSGFQVVPVRAANGLVIDTALAEMTEENYRQIIVAGGDGTINVCVNAMVKNGIVLPLAIFPVGTANDFATYFDIPNDIDGMVDVAMGDHKTKADVGVCNGKNFINVAALGRLVDVSQKTDPNLKNTLGVFAYYLKGLSEVKDLKPIPIKLTTPDAVYEESMYFMVVMNGMSAGGFKNIAPESDVSDGKLNVVLFREMSLVELASLAFKVRNGNHYESENVLTFETEHLIIESPEDVPTDVDGEHGQKLPLEFSVLKHRLDIFTEGQD